MTTTRVTIVDDHVLVAEAMAAALSLGGIADVSLVDPGELPSVVVTQVVETRPDLALVDLMLADGRSGAGLVPLLVDAGVRVAIVTADPQRASMATGAVAVLDKALPFRRLLAEVADVAGQARRDDGLDRLTSAEGRVLADLMDGRTVSEIAELRRVSVTTVRTHVRGILAKLGVRNQLAAVAVAHRSGWSLSTD